MQKDNLKFYRVECVDLESPYLANTKFTLLQLREELKKMAYHDENFDIYYHWKNLTPDKFGKLTLKQIIEEDVMEVPVFYAIKHVQNIDFPESCPYIKKYAQGVVSHHNQEEQKKQISQGENGHILFDNRNAAILASSVNYASSQEPFQSTKKIINKNFHGSMIEPESQIVQNQPGFISRILQRIGIISKEPSTKNLHNTIKALKKIETKEQLKEHIQREYSDYDPKFAAYLQAIYLKFAILSAFKLHYIECKTMGDSVILKTFDKHTKIGIIGDFGTGLPDSIALLTDLIINKSVDIILHLGDVYYAGTPHEYDNNITKLLDNLTVKAKRQILFYSIPGNHDYYSWGLPFLCFIKSVNSDVFTKQTASYFCLRSTDQKWQFVGLDTAYHDSNPANQINGASLGPSIHKKQIQWFEDKLQNFPGSTILLTHHQLFSIHERICGSFTSYRHFSCVNPILSAQLFKYIPHISAWYWGHQHSFMLFADGAAGAQKCRLLGNSSFHVFEKENPYSRKKNFPIIPFVQQDQKYNEKYLPINPNQKNNKQNYYNLCYAMIDFSKSTDNYLPTQYYCCPCFNPDENPSKQFKPYLIYEEQIKSRFLFQQPVKFQSTLQIKSEIGLCIETNDRLTLGGKKFIIKLIQEKADKSEFVSDGDEVQFCICKSNQAQNDPAKSFLTGKRFIIEKKRVMKDTSCFIKFGDVILLRLKQNETNYLCSEIGGGGPYIDIHNHECLFMFIKDSMITDTSNPYVAQSDSNNEK